MSPNSLKDIAEIAQALTVTCVAIAGGWLYWHRRQRFPRAVMRHNVEHIKISDSKIMLRVLVTIANGGEVLIRANKGFTWVQQIMPGAEEFLEVAEPQDIGGCHVRWPLIGEQNATLTEIVEIEPQEEQEFCFEFILPSDIETLSIYSHFENAKKGKSQLGWNKTSIYATRQNVKEIASCTESNQ